MMKLRYPDRSESELVGEAKALAAKYVREGWGSRASVIHAIYDLFDPDLPPEMFMRFCSVLDPLHAPAAASHYPDGRRAGVTTCGALVSGLLAFSMIYAQRQLPFKFWADVRPDSWLGKALDDPEMSPREKLGLFNSELDKMGYGAYEHITKRFYEEFGTTDCYDIQKPYGNPLARECFRNCARVIIWTAGMVTEVIMAYAKEPSAFRLTDDNVNVAILRGGDR